MRITKRRGSDCHRWMWLDRGSCRSGYIMGVDWVSKLRAIMVCVGINKLYYGDIRVGKWVMRLNHLVCGCVTGVGDATSSLLLSSWWLLMFVGVNMGTRLFIIVRVRVRVRVRVGLGVRVRVRVRSEI